MAVTHWIVDKSAHVRMLAGARCPVPASSLAMCPVGELEWLFSAQSADDYDAQTASLRRVFRTLEAPATAFADVRTLQRDLAHHHGLWHRTPLPDLFIAVTALHHGAGVLHADADYDRIAAVRPQLQLATIGPHPLL